MDYKVIREAIDVIIGFKIGIRNRIPDDVLKLAEEALWKQIPRSPLIKKWSPALCPTCKSELSESIGDGYYKHYYNLKICECGQKLEWD
ncbi:MAG: hypothetical protein A4E53_01521 [Pelotomaculum sp. PtaB.Bin104]|nr:MAG: hypothetical protein A4E53_01521 [Pelotomaculum sp. PtaB.Bin104]